MSQSNKKKILFLSPNYPFGNFGPSTMCSFRIMKALCETQKYEIHCISYSGDKPSYELIPEIKLHILPFQAPRHKKDRYKIYLDYLLKLPIYPFLTPQLNYRVYKKCIPICQQEDFDLAIAQCYQEDSYWSATMLKRNGYIRSLGVIFWDNLYGKNPARFINKKFAEYRNRKVETFVAKHSDFLISLYPIKSFHDKHGDLPLARGKRHYLGIPSVIKPNSPVQTIHTNVVKEGQINILFSGSIIRREFIYYAIEVFSQCGHSQDINLIFFSRGMSKNEFETLSNQFEGSIEYSDYIPIKELHSVYNEVNCFISVPGDPHSICSKIFEYVSFGLPVIIFYKEEYDVNISTFRKYPLALTLDIKAPSLINAKLVDEFFKHQLEKRLPFEDTERLFYYDTPKAYVEFIEGFLNQLKT